MSLIHNSSEQRYPAPPIMDDDSDKGELESEDDSLGGGEATAREREEREADQLETDNEDVEPLGSKAIAARALQEVRLLPLLH